MEKLDSDGVSDSRPIDAPARAGKSRRRSFENLHIDQAKDDTGQAENSQIDLEIELSILQSNYEKCLNYGLNARVMQRTAADNQMPVLLIQMLNISKCPGCGNWIVGLKCPTC